MAAKKLSLADLSKAVSPAAVAKPGTGSLKSKKMKQALTNRLVAGEFLRNGLDIRAAWESVTKRPYHPRYFQALVEGEDNLFLSEIDAALRTADVDKNKVLGILWVQATSVIFDFMDDDGQFLSIAEIKQLPREVQALVEEVRVQTTYDYVKDDEGNKVLGDDGKPLMMPRQKVHLKFPQKQTALNTIAQIGKLIGPTTVNTTVITNIGQIMVDADNRRGRILAERAARVIDHEPDDGA